MQRLYPHLYVAIPPAFPTAPPLAWPSPFLAFTASPPPCTLLFVAAACPTFSHGLYCLCVPDPLPPALPSFYLPAPFWFILPCSLGPNNHCMPPPSVLLHTFNIVVTG